MDEDRLQDDLSKIFGSNDDPPITAGDHMNHAMSTAIDKLIPHFVSMNDPLNMARMQAIAFERKVIVIDLAEHPMQALMFEQFDGLLREEWMIESRFENPLTTRVVLILSRLKKGELK